MKFLSAALSVAAMFVIPADGGEYRDGSGAGIGIGRSRTPERAAGAAHDGFRIDPTPGTAWLLIRSAQRPDFAQWAKPDPADVRHTTVAEVRISAPLPRPVTMEQLKKAMENKLKRQETWRIRDFGYTLGEGMRRGMPSLEIHTECTDAGTSPVSRMFSDGFMLITRERRLLVVTVSERSNAPGFKYDGGNAREFMRFVRW